MGTRRIALAAVLFVACGPPRPSGAVRYEVTFEGRWTQTSHPIDYPTGPALDPASAHFSGIIGAAHAAGFSLFDEGGLATPGLIALAHTGAHSPLDAELDEAAEAGEAAPRFGTGIFLEVNSPQTVSFDASPEFPLVSLVTMIAPSPDWFVGLFGVSLRPGGDWANELSVEAFAWDAGAYEGTTYKAPEALTQPQGLITQNVAPPFTGAAASRPIAVVTFRRR